MEIATKTIDLNDNLKSIIDITHLKNIEFSIIYHMYKSKKDFDLIVSKISKDDFTFEISRDFFEYLVSAEKEKDIFNLSEIDEDELIFKIVNIYGYELSTVVKILNNFFHHCYTLEDLLIPDPKELNLEVDIFELLHFSQQKKEIISDKDDEDIYFFIEDEYGQYKATFSNGFIKDITAQYYFHLPEELCDTFTNTFKKILPYVEDKEYNFTLLLNEYDDEVAGYNFTKNITKIKQVETLLQWAKKFKITYIAFGSRGEILNFDDKIKFSNFGIKYIPKELFTIKKEAIFFELDYNQIDSLPSGISSSKCQVLKLCNNNFTQFPKSVYELKNLSTLCLHNNKIKNLPDDIGKLDQLLSLSISNNPIKKLPKSFYKLKLNVLNIENTFIEEDTLKHINFEKIEEICFNDNLLPYFLKNLDKMKGIDTINLAHSNYTKDNKLIPKFLKIENKKWMEEKDYIGFGCVMLKNSNVDEG